MFCWYWIQNIHFLTLGAATADKKVQLLKKLTAPLEEKFQGDASNTCWDVFSLNQSSGRINIASSRTGNIRVDYNFKALIWKPANTFWNGAFIIMTNTAAVSQDFGMKFSKPELEEAKIICTQTAGTSVKTCQIIKSWWEPSGNFWQTWTSCVDKTLVKSWNY